MKVTFIEPNNRKMLKEMKNGDVFVGNHNDDNHYMRIGPLNALKLSNFGVVGWTNSHFAFDVIGTVRFEF